ncbi:MAG: hypothetical protein M0024_09660 [Nitrospiraceae bacterium]|nr:hypothetical protein [Nitrospiraceae bacterium]
MKSGLKANGVKKKLVSALIVTLFLPGFCMTPATFAVSYPAQLYHQEVRHDKFVKGDTVYLFHSGTEDVRKAIHVNDTLAVYRTSPSCEVSPVGIIRIMSFVGETYIKGEVFAGEIKPDDIAKTKAASCLVISAGICDH